MHVRFYPRWLNRIICALTHHNWEDIGCIKYPRRLGETVTISTHPRYYARCGSCKKYVEFFECELAEYRAAKGEG